MSDGEDKNRKPFFFAEREFPIRHGKHWKTDPEIGGNRLSKAERVVQQGETVWYKRFVDDFSVVPMSDRWESVQVGRELIYVVQTSPTIIERCLLMTTDPGDLVFDPTCGSGTTAYVAERWGRRWITCDSSRVALALAKHRVMTAKFEYYQLRPLSEEQINIEELGSIANDWIDYETTTQFKPGMFVARVRGDSMEPLIPANSYCLFRQPADGLRQGRKLLIWHRGVTDSETGGEYTVKVYESEKTALDDEQWEHKSIKLKPLNPKYEPILLTPADEGDVRVLADC
jgi:hypothetical protein